MDLNAVGGRHDTEIIRSPRMRCGAGEMGDAIGTMSNGDHVAEKSSIKIRKCVRHTRTSLILRALCVCVRLRHVADIDAFAANIQNIQYWMWWLIFTGDFYSQFPLYRRITVARSRWVYDILLDALFFTFSQELTDQIKLDLKSSVHLLLT